MSKNILKILSAISVALIMISSNAYAANPASFVLSPSSNSVTNGNSFDVSVYENGDNVNVVTIRLDYDSSKLQFLGSTCGSTLPSAISESSGVTCYVIGSTVIGSALVANFSFKAISESVSASVSIASGSKIAVNGVNVWDQVGSLATINLVAATPPAPSPETTPVVIKQNTDLNTHNDTKTTTVDSNDSTAVTDADNSKGTVQGLTDPENNVDISKDNTSTENKQQDGNTRSIITTVLMGVAIASIIIYYFFETRISGYFKRFSKLFSSKNNSKEAVSKRKRN